MDAHVCTANMISDVPITEDLFVSAVQGLCVHLMTAHPDASGPKGQFVICCQPDDAPAVEEYIGRYVARAQRLAADLGLLGADFGPGPEDMVLIDMPPPDGVLFTVSMKLPEQKGT